MDCRSQRKSRMAPVTFARELLCLDRAGSMLNITSQWQDTEILIFCYIRVYYKKLGHMLKPLAPKFHSDLSVCLRDIAEKEVSAKLKPIEVHRNISTGRKCHRLSLFAHFSLTGLSWVLV